MNATGIPLNSLITYSGNNVLPVSLTITLAAKYWKSAPLNSVGPWQPVTGWQPPFCLRSNSPMPLSNSWLPTEVASKPANDNASIEGSSWNIEDNSGLAPTISPAATTMLFGLSFFISLINVAMCSIPPGLFGPGAFSAPWKSFIAITRTSTTLASS